MTTSFDLGSFKDPDGRVFHHDGDVFRTVAPNRIDEVEGLGRTAGFQSLVADGLVLPFEVVSTDSLGLDPGALGQRVLRQRRIPFVSYPAEWSFEMLRRAALTTLEIAERSLRLGYILKDATPFNIVMEAGAPRFVDILSFEAYQAGRPWAAYGQFCRAFLYPLLIAAYRRIDVRPWLLANDHEIAPGTARRFFSWYDALRPGVGKDVFLAAWLERLAPGAAGTAATAQVHVSQAMLAANLSRLRKIVTSLPSPYLRPGPWSAYAGDNSYSQDDTTQKQALVERLLQAAKPGRVIDIGANTGVYSRLAAKFATGSVIAMDADPAVIDALAMSSLLSTSSATGAEIYPVVADLTHPTPATGWALAERPSLLARLPGDFFLALAVIHHLRVAGNVPFAMILEQLAAIAPQGIIEWVGPEDEMARHLMAQRRCIYADFHYESFMSSLKDIFEVTADFPLKQGKRRLLAVRARRLGPAAR